jgi:hypothetical protein
MSVDGEKKVADSFLSRVREGMRTYGSPLLTLAILFVVAGNLAATSRVRSTMEQLLERGIVQQAPQDGATTWTDAHGLVHEVRTPRAQHEEDAAWSVRHRQIVAVMLEAFPVKQ